MVPKSRPRAAYRPGSPSRRRTVPEPGEPSAVRRYRYSRTPTALSVLTWRLQSWPLSSNALQFCGLRAQCKRHLPAVYLDDAAVCIRGPGADRRPDRVHRADCHPDRRRRRRSRRVRVVQRRPAWRLRAHRGREGANVQDGSVLHAPPGIPVDVGPGATVAHGCGIHGVHVGSEAVIANHATVLDGAVIGARSLIAAHSLVTAIQDPPTSRGRRRRRRSRARLPGRARRCRSGRIRAPTTNWPGGYRRLAEVTEPPSVTTHFPGGRCCGPVHLPVRAQRDQLALVIHLVREDALRGHLVAVVITMCRRWLPRCRIDTRCGRRTRGCGACDNVVPERRIASRPR